MDAVDETSVAVRARLVRPRILLFAGEDEGDEEREGNAPSAAAERGFSLGRHAARASGVVDFGAAQAHARSKRRRAMVVNPFEDKTLCVRLMPVVVADPSWTNAEPSRDARRGIFGGFLGGFFGGGGGGGGGDASGAAAALSLIHI